MTQPKDIFIMKAASLWGIFLCIFIFLVSPCLSELCNQNDQNTLLQIKKSLNNPPLLSSWDPKTDCCTNWTGISCSSTTTAKNNRVIGISLYGGGDNFVLGKIPHEIGNLPFLKSLQLNYFHDITGSIPATFSKLKQLETLIIVGTRICGSIPEFIGELKNLRRLDLYNNKLTGSIPSSIASIPNIHSIYLASNKLTGSIPESFGSFKNKGVKLYLYDNRLSGTIPKSLSKSSFSVVNLSRNKLRGDLSIFLGDDKTTEVLDVSRNEIEFDFSKMKFPKNLTLLYMDHNRIFGEIPQVLATLSLLESLEFSYNRLCGKIPVGGVLQYVNPDWYSHNRCLCGAPLERKC